MTENAAIFKMNRTSDSTISKVDQNSQGPLAFDILKNTVLWSTSKSFLYQIWQHSFYHFGDFLWFSKIFWETFSLQNFKTFPKSPPCPSRTAAIDHDWSGLGRLVSIMTSSSMVARNPWTQHDPIRTCSPFASCVRFDVRSGGNRLRFSTILRAGDL